MLIFPQLDKPGHTGKYDCKVPGSEEQFCFQPENFPLLLRPVSAAFTPVFEPQPSPIY